MAAADAGLPGALVGLSAEVAALAERIRQSVVVVRGERTGQGSGVVWAADGLVLTNHHVVASDRAEIDLADGRRFAGTVVRRDQEHDLAAIRVQAADLPTALVGDPRSARAGEIVLAVGNPLGVPGAVSAGVFGGMVREGAAGRHRLSEMVRADVRLYPGNSGGPLIDARGRVLGINSMVAGAGVALAVPSHVAEAFASAGGGAGSGVYLGVSGQRVDVPEALRASGAAAGVLVHSVAEGSPAEAAGLLLGDILLAVDGQPLADGRDLGRRLAVLGAGRVARLTVLRGGRLLDVTARTVERRAA